MLEDLNYSFSVEVLKEITDRFHSEVNLAYWDRTMLLTSMSSLECLVSRLPEKSIVEENEVFQAMVFGGTFGSTAVAQRRADQVVVLEQEDNIRLPVFTKKDDFLAHVVTGLHPDTKTLAVNFAYPLKSEFREGRPDGTFLWVDSSRSIRADDFKGVMVGEELERYIFDSQNGRKVEVALAGDGACLLAAGCSKYSPRELAFGIVGTGTNAGLFVEDNYTVVLESAEFNRFPQSKTGRRLTLQYGGSPFGKETNGNSLFEHVNDLALEVGIDHVSLTSSEQVSELARSKTPVLSDIAKQVIERAAQLIACQSAGIAEYKRHDTTFVMEGGVFWKADDFKKIVEETVAQLTSYKITFDQIPNSPIIGALNLVARG